ncbi:MAG: exopolysaccharide production protein ExoZ [Sphingomonadales bacterium]|jgi:exopolysaccharide production protein ExoZ|nr:exopolysaccharide production protein ExoZ [Sphingomonadales bacterium]
MLVNLQAVRALAAIGVMLFHFGLMPATNLPFQVGAAGVDIFFVLSGFIIAHSSTRSARHFLAHRLIRVVPAYWIATLIAALFTLQSISLADASGWLVQSLFYLPGPEGRPALIFVAWTLVYELAFYLLYWSALRFGVRPAPLVALALLLLLAVVPLPRALGPWPLLLEFGLGVGIFLLTERLRAGRAIRGPAGLAMAGLGIALLAATPLLTSYDPADYQSLQRVVGWGLPSAAVIFGLVVAEQRGIAVRSKPVLLVGAASYAIYLLHPIVLGQLLQLPGAAPPLSWLYCSIAVAFTIGLSVAFHLAIEAPLLRWMRASLRDPPPVEQRAPAEIPPET